METKDMEILGAKVKGDLYCHYSFRQAIGKDVFDSGTLKSERIMHDDLRKAFAAVTIHLPLILEDLKPGDIADINSEISGQKFTEEALAVIAKFRLTEFLVDPEQGSVCLIGTKSLDLGIQPIETPYVKWEGAYHYALELRVAIDTLINEVLLYIGGKAAPQLEQGDLFADADQPGGEIETPEKPKKRGRGRPKNPKKKTVVGLFEDSNFPDYYGKEIIAEADAEDGDIIGVDTADGSPIIKGVPAGNGYVPAPDSEFQQPVTAFQQDPADIDEL